MIGFLLLAAHALGDGPLQNHWMQTKSKSSFVCTIHVTMYSIGFIALYALNLLPWWALYAILIQHWLQDRFALHLKWMRFSNKPRLKAVRHRNRSGRGRRVFRERAFNDR